LAKRYNRDYREIKEVFNVAAWEPATELGKLVKAGSVTSIEQILSMGKRISEVEIVDALLPDLKNEVVEITSVQRMTRNGRRQKFRATAIVGDENGHVGVGSGKDIETKAAIDSAIKSAKRNIIPVVLGCGSWQCKCGQPHSLPFNVRGKCGSVEVLLRTGPKGLGVVASRYVKRMLELGGVKDIWTFSRGRTRTKYNTLMAVLDALKSILRMKNIESANVLEK